MNIEQLAVKLSRTSVDGPRGPEDHLSRSITSSAAPSDALGDRHRISLESFSDPGDHFPSSVVPGSDTDPARRDLDSSAGQVGNPVDLILREFVNGGDGVNDYGADEDQDEDEDEGEDEDGDQNESRDEDGDEDSSNHGTPGELTANASKPWAKRMSEGRRKRHGEFSKWVSEKSKEIRLENAVVKEVSEERMSSQAMVLASHKSIISDPRQYQLELFEIAKKRNTIAVLDTGSGKTLIACLLIRHMVDQELEARQAGRHRRVSFFLVHNVTLVFQQAAVLQCNIDATVGKYCGEMGASLWQKEVWDGILDREQVIVMTADVMYNCLVHAFVRMEDVNLLCFDEAHHAKKKHTYARIIKEFYLPQPENSRPKIFGMTASPVDSRAHVIEAAAELEKLLDSQITTTSDLMMLQSSISRPKEVVATYPKLRQPFRTKLFKQLHESYGSLECFAKVFSFSELASSELGSWCSDILWKFALAEEEAHKAERKEERNLDAQPDSESLTKVEKDIHLLREAAEVVQGHEFPAPRLLECDLSMKVILLWGYLSKVYREDTAGKCIIFVSRRYTARVLGELFTQLGNPHLRLGVLVGARAGFVGDENMTFRRQMTIVSQFRRGKLNCLIATSVAEEGLDIPDCSLVIRFDLYSTMIQYIQSRGRARHSRSSYIHMIEEGNPEHLRMIHDVRGAEEIMRVFCRSLPADRILDDQESDQSPLPDCSEGPVYVEPATGARLTFSSAMQIIGHYVANLPREDEDILQPFYNVTTIDAGQYICELRLPSSSPVLLVEGSPMASKATAKRSAAFEACLQLRSKKCLDAYLLPTSRPKRLPRMANARLALDIHKTNVYTFKPKPNFWRVEDGAQPAELWVTILLLSKPEAIGHELQPICLITRKKLPEIPAFPVYSDTAGQSDMVLLRLCQPLVATPVILEVLSNLTIRLFYDIFNKLFDLNSAKMPYWIAPIRSELGLSNLTEDSSPEAVLDWELLEWIISALELEWDDNTPIENLFGRLFIDRRQRSRRYIVHGYDPTLTSKDPVPDFIICSGMVNIQDYSYNAGKKGGKWKCVKWEIPEWEPVLLADRLLHRINYLDPPSKKEMDTVTAACICPSAFTISLIPSCLARMTMIFPAVITRVDSYLHAWELCKLLGVHLKLDLALEAITKDSDNTHEHGKEQQHARKGMGNNYERLEFLGDCFLKLATSLSLFVEHHGDDEFELHVKRMVLICNKHLFEKARLLNIPAYIQTEGFSRRFWYPELKQLLGKTTGKDIATNGISRKIADKSISDVCEALIGAALLDKGLDGATHMVTVLLQTPYHTQREWADYFKGYKIPQYQLLAPTAAQKKLVADIEQSLGYRFKAPGLLMSAFTHPSNPSSWERIPSYQRLEFLGDALLDQACVRYIFDKYPDADPQWLTEHKMAMVSNKFLAAVSVLMGFHRKLRRLGQHLDFAIRDYVAEIHEAKENSGGAVDFWASVSSPPKALPDILEAFIGAMFIDSGFNFAVVEDFFDDHILPYFVDMTVYDNFAGQHPTTFWTKCVTNLGCEVWGYESQQCTDGGNTYVLTAILIHNKVFAYGQEPTVKASKVSVSRKAIEKLESQEGMEEFRNLCDCRGKES